jgi:hypothetical protein
MNTIDLPRNVFGKIFQPVFVASTEVVSAFSIPYGNDVHIPSVSGKQRLYIYCSRRVLMHIGVGLMVMEPKHLLVRELAVKRCVGTCGHPFILRGKEHEVSRCLCAKGSRANCMLCCYMVFSW